MHSIYIFLFFLFTFKELLLFIVTTRFLSNANHNLFWFLAEHFYLIFMEFLSLLSLPVSDTLRVFFKTNFTGKVSSIHKCSILCRLVFSCYISFHVHKVCIGKYLFVTPINQLQRKLGMIWNLHLVKNCCTWQEGHVGFEFVFKTKGNFCNVAKFNFNPRLVLRSFWLHTWEHVFLLILMVTKIH